MLDIIKNEFDLHFETIKAVQEHNLAVKVSKATDLVIATLKAGNKVLIFGNGGSAADAQHFATELTARYKLERQALGALALTTDTSALTAVANDYSYDVVFKRQVEALGRKGDLLIGISTSGNSENIVQAFKEGKKIGTKILGFSGNDGGAMNEFCDINLVVPSFDTPRIQEMHILFFHSICHCVDLAFTQK